MNKPPETEEDIWQAFDRILKEHIDMKKKTENLTTQEAWIAMVNGECVGTNSFIQRINGQSLRYWNHGWLYTCGLGDGPYSIVPDPSKPKEEEDEYEREWHSMIVDWGMRPEQADALKALLGKYFQRKS